jgi:[acyl-carrier-protein] S-malonyltransferase
MTGRFSSPTGHIQYNAAASAHCSFNFNGRALPKIAIFTILPFSIRENMPKTVFLFPGQGSQEVGMARDLFKDDEYFISLVAEASRLTGEDLQKVCLKGPEKQLVLARYLQPLLTAVSLGYLRHVRERGISADMVLGHSLGEITALAAAGIVTDPEAVAIAAKRGALMDEAAAVCAGSMMEEILASLNQPEKIVLANDNAPNQIVVSGDNDLLDEFSLRAAALGGKCKRLVVSGPWHSPFLRRAREKFEIWAETIRFHKPRVPIVLNAIAKPDDHPSSIKHLVTWQLTSPVFFRECMAFCHDAGVDSFLEIGPGRVLSGLVRVNGFKREAKIFNVNSMQGVAVAAEELGHRE